jgi:hypothetical protein
VNLDPFVLLANRDGALPIPGFELGSRVSPALLDYSLLTGIFIVSRLALLAVGLPFELELRWMFLADTAVRKLPDAFHWSEMRRRTAPTIP